MKKSQLLKNKPVRYTLIGLLIAFVIYMLLRLTLFPADPLIPLLNSIYEIYLFIPEAMANLLFQLKESGVFIADHAFVFESAEEYPEIYSKFMLNWSSYLLFKRWSLLIILLIWVIKSPVRKKIIYTGFFVLVHMISVFSGLVLLASAAPAIYAVKPGIFLSPTLVGSLFMFIFLSVWVRLNLTGIQAFLKSLGIKFELELKKVNEIIILLFFFVILRSFLIPFIDYKAYVNFLLETTKMIVSIWDYEAFIDGDQLIGINGALAVSKHCLGFMTMYLFAAMIFLTRSGNNKTTWIFISSGLVFLFILNIIRFVVLFFIVQGENGFERATYHHEIYNIIIYAIVFVLWIVWYEFFILKSKRKKSIQKS